MGIDQALTSFGATRSIICISAILNGSSGKLNGNAENLSRQTEQVAAASEEISATVESVANVAKETSASAGQSSKASQHLSALAVELQQLVSGFKLRTESDFNGNNHEAYRPHGVRQTAHNFKEETGV